MSKALVQVYVFSRHYTLKRLDYKFPWTHVILTQNSRTKRAGYFISTSAYRIGQKFYLGENMGTDEIKKVKAGEYLDGVRVMETSRGIDERKIERGLNVLRNNSGQSL